MNGKKKIDPKKTDPKFVDRMTIRQIHPLEVYLISRKISVPEFAIMCRISPPTILRIIKNEKYGGIKASKRTIRQILRRAKTLTWKDFGYGEQD